MAKIYDPVDCDSFQDFIKKIRELPVDSPHQWIYRGHEKAYWGLRTSLERECGWFGMSGDEIFRREYNMVRELSSP